jgi:AcrR family transcriptional regulator
MKCADRKAAIVQSASRLFAKKGFRGATTRELAAELGVTEPVLYQHFRTKRDLYNAIIESKAAEASPRAAELMRLAAGNDDRVFLQALGEAILERYECDPELFRLLLHSCLEGHEVSGLLFDGYLAELFRIVAGYIRRRTAEGAFRKINARAAAMGLIGMISYHGHLSLLFPDKVRRPQRRQVVSDMVGLFLGGIAIESPLSGEAEAALARAAAAG